MHHNGKISAFFHPERTITQILSICNNLFSISVIEYGLKYKTPSLHTSGIEQQEEAIVGVPHDIACNGGYPNPSLSEG